MNHQELIERLRGFEIDHSPDGWPAIRMREISEMCDAIEYLLAENERMKAELAKYRDAPVVAWRFELKAGEYAFCSQKNAEANKAMLTPENHAVQLIVKPGE